MKRLEIKGVEMAYVTMHCGLGNFREIDVEDLSKHKMESEEMHVGERACNIINKAKDSGHHVCAVGTTVQRTLETAIGADGHLQEFDGWTNKFIYPPYDFGLADCMVANFYMPYSTLLMLTCAFGGYDLVMKAYNEALRDSRYRFGTYGDAMLIMKD
jgi:S-adenosylmethionine:tRNA ribosyltransferase-isomerase